MTRKRKSYKRITFEDRKRIEELNKQGATVDEIAFKIGVCTATIYRELVRGEKDDKPYSADVAQKKL